MLLNMPFSTFKNALHVNLSVQLLINANIYKITMFA